LALRVLSIVPDIYDLELIGSGSVSVMAKPVAGEWIDDEFSGISKHGITRIISLLERSEAYEVGLKDEEIYAEKHQLEFVSYPIPDRGLPSSINEFSRFTKDLYQSAAKGNNIVIHCRAGIGRTGIVAAGVLLHCGFTAEQAFKHISEKRGVSVPDTPEQENWVIENESAIINT
jgi:protein-tyrosine phosphatase